jgi:hypothetical protein
MHTDATLRYHASYNMVLHIHRDASYLSVSIAHSRIGVIFFCGNKPSEEDKINGSILNASSFIKAVVVLAAESEVGARFQNAQSGVPLRVTLMELGHN